MGKRTYIIEFHRENNEEAHSEYKEKSHEHHKEHKTRAKMKDVFGEVDSFMKYEEKHGMHFSEKLSSFVSSKMVNVSEIDRITLKHPETPIHSWTAKEVEDAMVKLGLKFDPIHRYDYHYAANMAYADFFGLSIKEEALCLKHAHAMVHDPDGYPELVFSRWLCDTIGKNMEIEWDKFI